MKATFFQDNFGNESNSRLIVDICVVVALIFSAIILYLGRNDVMIAAGAVAIVFNSIAIPCLTFLFGQKKNESEIEINAKKQDTIIEQSVKELT